MAQITKTVDKSSVTGSEVFIYTINAAFSGLTLTSHKGNLVDFFPRRVKYVLPKTGGQILSITEKAVTDGTEVALSIGN